VITRFRSDLDNQITHSHFLTCQKAILKANQSYPLDIQDNIIMNHLDQVIVLPSHLKLKLTHLCLSKDYKRIFRKLDLNSLYEFYDLIVHPYFRSHGNK
jgi:hypothetical protein